MTKNTLHADTPSLGQRMLETEARHSVRARSKVEACNARAEALGGDIDEMRARIEADLAQVKVDFPKK